jgi:hypothetical protein
MAPPTPTVSPSSLGALPGSPWAATVFQGTEATE